MRFLLAILLFFSSGISAQNLLTGLVLDSKNKEPLAFVNITINDLQRGTVTDIDGKFSIKIPTAGSVLHFSYVGYEPFSLRVSDELIEQGKVTVRLEKKNVLLREFVVLPGENPAHRIIRNAIENSKKNNPEKLSSFSYTSYNKMFFTPYSFVKDTLPEEKKDSVFFELEEFAEKQHLLLIETATEKYFQSGNSHEKVIGTRVSGLNSPIFAMLAAQLQSFSFYGDYISISEVKYHNPISKSSFSKYVYQLEDTLYSGNDTVFVIAYKPAKGSTFEGLTGVVYINTNQYAIQNVIAEPAEQNKNFRIKIQQQYEFIDNKQWFPVELYTEIVYNVSIGKHHHLLGLSRTQIRDISIEEGIDKKKFGRADFEIKGDALKKDSVFWDTVRRDSLSDKERTTYHVLDSLGKAEKLDLKFNALLAIAEGKIPIKSFDLEIDKLIRYNQYEGFRLGAGLRTNNRISETFSLGAYFGYGFNDRAWKYGGDFIFKPKGFAEPELRFFWQQDVVEAAGVEFLLDKKPGALEDYRNMYISRMDSSNITGASFSFRANKHFRAIIAGTRDARIATANYLFGNYRNEVLVTSSDFVFTELSAGFRFAYKERLIQTPRKTYSLGSNFPVVFVQISKGFKNVLDGDFDYWRIDFKADKTFDFRHYGKSSFRIMAGHIEGDVPYTKLFAGRGSFAGNFNVSVANTFETMGLNEFFSDTYASAFYAHSFGTILKRKSIQPELILVGNAGWGTLLNGQNHYNINFNTLEKGYYEAGIRINNLFVSGFSGFGVGFFQRLGPYSTGIIANDFAAKLSLSIKF
jgi:hypothetical protein